MPAVDLLLKMLDESWAGECESLAAVLAGVTVEEARWQHPAYEKVEPMPGLPLPGTILWQAAHLEHCARHYCEILRRRPVTQEPPTLPPDQSELLELTQSLQASRQVFREQLAALQEKDLTAPCARGWDVRTFVLMAIRHEAWHAGQIAIIRRLYRARAPGNVEIEL